MSQSYPLFVKRDIDGFFGLFIDNLIQLLMIVGMCSSICGMSGEDSRFLYEMILPGVAVSIVFGNLFYAWQAHRLAKKTGRSDVTAQPYGINTPSLLVYIFFVMGPVYQKTGSAEQAWIMGLIACLGSGVIEFVGAFFAEFIRRNTPRAALLSTLAGIAITYISMAFALQIFVKPLIAMLPMGILLLVFFAHVKMPIGLPGGLIAVLLGTAIAWGLTAVTHFWPEAPAWITINTMDVKAVEKSVEGASFYVPQFVGERVWNAVQNYNDWIVFLSVIIPMGLFNIVGSLQNIESAEAAGDKYPAMSSMAMNGLGTIVAALFGSCFPTTIYIGHPGWKALGARAGYSTINGIVVTVICLTGMIGVMNTIIPMESGVAILLWIGIIITAQSFQETPKEHAPAVAIGLFPAIAAWGSTVVMGAFIAIMLVLFGSGQADVVAQVTAQKLLEGNAGIEMNGFLLHGMLLMERGYIFTCMMLAAIGANLVDRKFLAAAVWSAIAAAFAFLGLTHAYQLSGNDLDYLLAFSKPNEGAMVFRATGIGIGYSLLAVLFASYWITSGKHKS